jgi:hypothetical protein
MNGLLGNLFNMGAAYLQHVTAVRAALLLPEPQALAALTEYVQGLSDASFIGFKMTVGGLAGAEARPQVQQQLQWIEHNADALRQGHFSNAQQDAGADADFQATLEMIDPWFETSPEQFQAHFQALMQKLSVAERERFVEHMHTATYNATENLRRLEESESSSWGGAIEDRIAYLQAKIQTGSGTDPAHAQRVAVQQEYVNRFQWLAQAAASWRPPAPPKPQPKPERAAAPAQVQSDGDVRQQFMQGDGQMDPAILQQFLERELQASIADGRTAPERAYALREMIGEVRGMVEDDRTGATPSEIIGKIQRIMASRHELVSTAGQHLIEGSEQACARARALLPHLSTLKGALVSGAIERRGDKTRAAKIELLTRGTRHIAHISTLEDDAAVVAFERTEMRPFALAVRELMLLPHLSIARPLWDCPITHAAPNRVFLSGGEDMRTLLAEVCKQKRLDPAAEVQARNHGQARWDALRGSAVAVFDWRPRVQTVLAKGEAAAALELAAVAYEHGLAIALGTPAVVLADEAQSLPFDIDIDPLSLRGANKKADRRALGKALDHALYGFQRMAGDSGIPATAQWLNAALAEHPRRRVFEGMGWLDPEHAKDMAAFRDAALQLLKEWGKDAPITLYPAWSASYPPPADQGPKRLFHVMPFSQSWSSAVAAGVEAACDAAGVVYERGDSSADDRIMRRMWDGICGAHFVLVDTTGLNLNVMMELGMAHALGRKTLMVEQQDKRIGKVRNLEKIEIERYAGAQGVKPLVAKWLQEVRA